MTKQQAECVIRDAMSTHKVLFGRWRMTAGQRAELLAEVERMPFTEWAKNEVAEIIVTRYGRK